MIGQSQSGEERKNRILEKAQCKQDCVFTIVILKSTLKNEFGNLCCLTVSDSESYLGCLKLPPRSVNLIYPIQPVPKCLYTAPLYCTTAPSALYTIPLARTTVPVHCASVPSALYQCTYRSVPCTRTPSTVQKNLVVKSAKLVVKSAKLVA